MTAARSPARLSVVVCGAVLAALLLVTLAVTTPAHASVDSGARPVAWRDAGRELAQARSATARFHRFDVSFTSGYRLLSDAEGIECIEHPGDGGMGIHVVNGDLVGDPQIDARRPEAVIYEPTRSGQLRLVAVEYVVFQDAWDAEHDEPPSLFGQGFTLIEAGNRYGLPAFYELHAWLWKHNPAGSFADYNPQVDCSGGNGARGASGTMQAL
ncbi:hypothetical protein BH20ACT8_BH20ACT8_21270 [soil metagenome]